jgi:hypothetical protein
LGEQLTLPPGRRSIPVATSGCPAAAMAGLGEAELVDRAPDGFARLDSDSAS